MVFFGEKLKDVGFQLQKLGTIRMHILQSKWESVEHLRCMPMGYTPNTCVSCIHVSICKVDLIMANTFMYVVVTLSNNKVMHIMSKQYRVATIAKH